MYLPTFYWLDIRIYMYIYVSLPWVLLSFHMYVCTYVCILYIHTVPLTLNLTHTRVCTRACTRLTRVKVNNLACIVSAACEFGVRTNARGILVMHDTNMLAMCTRFAI